MCRLGHKKSRKGCIACKRRRVKCDEQAPCRNCVRRGEQCSLLAPSPSVSGDRDSDGGLNTGEWMEDLRLMRHFILTTIVDEFGAHKSNRRLWQDTVSEEATRHPLMLVCIPSDADHGHFVLITFSLMHGVLALSALHIIHQSPGDAERHLRLCDNHQSKALETFRSILSTPLTKEMSAPMFGLATTISISSIARSCATALVLPEPRYVSMEQVAELFLLTRGVRSVVEACREWLDATPMAPMLSGYETPRDDQVPLHASIDEQFTALEHMTETACSDEQQTRICKEALSCLRDVYRSVSHYDAKDTLQTGHVFTWLTSVPMEFVILIQTSVPPALVILAHFASVSLAVRTVWYSKNWGNYCLQGISMELRGHALQPWLEWPKAHAETNMAILTPSIKTDEESPITYRHGDPTP